jgi:hypothetical protein
MAKPQPDVPEANLPGHHPDREQDKPSGEAFVRKLHEHATETAPDTEAPEDPEPTLAGDALRAAADAVRSVREALPGD